MARRSDARPAGLRPTPWLIALASATLAAAAAWDRPNVQQPRPLLPASRDGETARLRSEIGRKRAQNEALRRELDRLLVRLGGSTDRKGGSRGVPQTAEASPNAVLLDEELARQAKENVLRAVGDERHRAEALASLTSLVNEGGTNVFPAMRDIYETAADDGFRRSMLPMMLFTGGGDEALAFVASETITMADPEYRRRLLGAVANVIRPSAAGTFKAAFLAGLDDDDPITRATAIYGLRHIEDPDVTAALFRFAADDSEVVRALAIEYLVARSADREEIRRLLARDPSEPTRRIGECHLRLADGG
ncbi:MAG: HEAT repeat domain-containing protein [Actinomycetota bacterium]